jgi:ribosomal protein S18 acetylase RimI-like enzyme
MLQAYATDPTAFTATVAERENLPLAWWASRLSEAADAHECVCGAFADERLVGVAGLRFERRERTKHKATLFGMAVAPPFRGHGIGRALVEAVLDLARSALGTEIVQLTVSESNVAALRLYKSCGFRSFGTEPFAIRVGKRFVGKVHMWRSVGDR